MSGVHEGFGQQLFVGREEKVEAGALRPNSLYVRVSEDAPSLMKIASSLNKYGKAP